MGWEVEGSPRGRGYIYIYIYIYTHIADSLHCTAETDYYKAILLQ